MRGVGIVEKGLRKTLKRVQADLSEAQMAILDYERVQAKLEGEVAGLRTMALEFTRLAGENTGLRESAKTSAVEFTKVVLQLQAETERLKHALAERGVDRVT
jgi:hypothetical protein